MIDPAIDPAALEANLRGMHWKHLLKILMTNVVEHHKPEVLPEMIQRWLELDRTLGHSATTEEMETIVTLQAIQATAPELTPGHWFVGRVEHIPISGWIIEMCHFLKPRKRNAELLDRWWLLTARRHDDHAPLVGPVVPAPATALDLKKLRKIVAKAGGDPSREVLRTGPITEEERTALIEAGHADVAKNYGEIFWWWRA